MINELSFAQIHNELLKSLRGKCQHDAFFSTIHNSVQSRQLQTLEPVPEAGANSSKNTAASVEDHDESEYTSSDDVEDSEPVSPKQTPEVEGIQKTYELLRRQFFWPSMKKNVHQYVTSCQKCHVNKAERSKAGGLLHSLEIPAGKWESISMDFIVGLPKSQKGNDAIWFKVHHLTKMAHFIPTKTTVRAPELARLFVDGVFKLHRRDVQFSTSEKVYLRVPVDSKTLKSGVCAKLSPRYCGLFTISRRLGEVTYELELPHNSKIFPVFHVSQLRKALARSENLVEDSVLVLPLDPQQPPHEPEEIFYSRETQTCRTLYREYLVEWNDQPVENATWERDNVLHKIFSEFVLEDQDGS
ncbi:hypothetical protein O6H91_Y210100 [Diphasiastrum complanatum]|nr:hypothetical protein O6H91_Y210100 [Diphasiastrum complanatum]